MRAKILQILPMYHQAGEAILQAGADVVRTDNLEAEHLQQMVRQVDGVVLRAPARLTREIIAANPRLKVISGAGVGLDNIDVATASAYRIPVLHAPSVNAVSTAEQALALMLALARQIKPFQAKMALGDFAARNVILTHELRGKTIGLVGFGQIARELAKRCRRGLDMEVVAYVRRIDQDKERAAAAFDVRLTTDLTVLLQEADVVSLHIPLTDETRHFFGREHFSLMKTTAYLINTARGAVLHTDDLIEALNNGTIAGAGLDVFDPEPPPPDLPLLTMPNVVVTPHIGGITEEANYITATTVARNVLRTLRGEKPEYIANPHVLSDQKKPN
ncbi:NAD(P)-dependent oxidoreductase [Numidum massiliense]|uniref:NAD(P)-dependent oxidoreductase n=1 Tax=Numidum massiliense TaxID=1522315 RepID=UPI0006D53DC3|nr:NAD(P)-dependent oxidoreductase [Numidum massiliense]